jgi:hypothetical protein
LENGQVQIYVDPQRRGFIQTICVNGYIAPKITQLVKISECPDAEPMKSAPPPGLEYMEQFGNIFLPEEYIGAKVSRLTSQGFEPMRKEFIPFIPSETKRSDKRLLNKKNIEALQPAFLYRHFAGIKPTTEEFLGFSNKWGLLEENPYQIELERMRVLHRELKFAVRLWEIYKAKDEPRLRGFFSGYNNKQEPLVCHCKDLDTMETFKDLKLSEAEQSPQLWKHFKTAAGQFDMPVMIALLKLINCHVCNIGKQMILAAQGSSPELLFLDRAATLIDTMWLQFSNEVTDRKLVYCCMYCGKWGSVDDFCFMGKNPAYPYHSACDINERNKIKRRTAKNNPI